MIGDDDDNVEDKDTIIVDILDYNALPHDLLEVSIYLTLLTSSNAG